MHPAWQQPSASSLALTLCTPGGEVARLPHGSGRHGAWPRHPGAPPVPAARHAGGGLPPSAERSPAAVDAPARGRLGRVPAGRAAARAALRAACALHAARLRHVPLAAGTPPLHRSRRTAHAAAAVAAARRLRARLRAMPHADRLVAAGAPVLLRRHMRRAAAVAAAGGARPNPNPQPSPSPSPSPLTLTPNHHPSPLTPHPSPLTPDQAHGLTAAQFAALLGWCALEARTPPQQLRTPEPSSASREASASPHAAATLKLKALFAHLQLSRGAQQLRSREAANGPGSPLAA